MSVQKVFLIISIIIMISVSCKKEDDNGGIPITEIDERLSPLLFDKNSYWLYFNQETQTFDSVVVEEVTSYTMYQKIGGNTGSKVVESKYSSRVYGRYSEFFHGYVISRGDMFGNFIYLASHQKGDSSLNAVINEVHDTVVINGTVYKNVVEMHVYPDSYITQEMKLFYKDSVGIIRKEILNNNSDKWDLVRYDVRLHKLQIAKW